MLSACSSGTLTNVLPHRNADTGHDTPPHHIIQTPGQPAVMLSIDVERHTGIDSYQL